MNAVPAVNPGGPMFFLPPGPPGALPVLNAPATGASGSLCEPARNREGADDEGLLMRAASSAETACISDTAIGAAAISIVSISPMLLASATACRSRVRSTPFVPARYAFSPRMRATPSTRSTYCHASSSKRKIASVPMPSIMYGSIGSLLSPIAPPAREASTRC